MLQDAATVRFYHENFSKQFIWLIAVFFNFVGVQRRHHTLYIYMYITSVYTYLYVLSDFHGSEYEIVERLCNYNETQ